MATKIGIIGKGNVGNALQRGLSRAGHDVRAVGREPGAVREPGAWAEVLFLAVPFGALDETLRELGRQIGFDAVDAGPLRNARWLEALGYLNILLGYFQKLGPDIGFRLVR